MRNAALLLMALLVPFLTSCKEIGNLQMAQDRPEDVQQLLEQHEYARARRLTGKYPALDTAELQALISTREVAYEDDIIIRARKLESAHDFLGAVQLLSNTLQKVPASNRLREYRNELEKERLEKVRINERHQLLARAEYVLNQEIFYQQQHNLQSPNIIQRWEQTRNDRESETLAQQLRIHGEHALHENDLDIALECLQLSNSLDNTSPTRDLLDEIEALKNSQRKVARKKANINKTRKEYRLKQIREKETRNLLEVTRQALLLDELALAHANFNRLPLSVRESSEVNELRDSLNLAISNRVTKLTSRGDSEYRTDDVDTAISTWSEALELDPENKNLQERLGRAVRVLAKLEQLKQQQVK